MMPSYQHLQMLQLRHNKFSSLQIHFAIVNDNTVPLLPVTTPIWQQDKPACMELICNQLYLYFNQLVSLAHQAGVITEDC